MGKPPAAARWPRGAWAQPLALLAGVLAGLAIGHAWHGAHQVQLLEAMLPGAAGGQPVRTSFGFRAALHDFSGGSSSSSSSSTQASSGEASSSQAAGANEWGPARDQFFRGGGGGGRQSLWYSASNATRLTPGDASRISRVLAKRAAQLPGDSVHALMTGNGSPYQNIQARIMYATMKLVQGMPGGENIKAFTRILHRTADDDLVGEFPTFRAYPLQPACDTWCEFPVKDRPNAVVQWLLAAEQHPEELVQGAWLLLLESDYAWMRPLQVPGSAHDLAVQGLGFTYDYIDPQYPDAARVMRQMCPECDVAAIPKSGPSPVLLRPSELARVGPDWEAFAAWIEGNDDARNTLGWVREMYAWCAAVHKNGVRLAHELPPKSRLMSQPPHDWARGEAAFLHYTWGSLYFSGKDEVWRFDKRDWTAKEHELKVPQFTLPPQPWQVGWKLQDGTRVNQDLHQLLTDMLAQMNKASAGLPQLTPRAPP